MKLYNKMTELVYPRFREIILYIIIGSLSAGTDLFLYSILTKYSNINYLIINFFTVLVGIILSFTLNRKYNFKIIDFVFKRFIIFFSIGFVGMIVSSIFLYFFIELFYLDMFLSKFLSIILVVVIQFLLNKFITFKK